jgi:hypothetical protein
MMTQQEIFKAVMALPLDERSELLKTLERNLKGIDDKNGDNNEVLSRAEIIAERKRAIDRLRGVASVPGKKPPTDEEWREERTNYLLEKYK